ncbi:MAG TPA: hypothetical protein DDX84_00325 [Nitrospiraceae bacterium]|nr:hypothetical protein [Nitrospiraceae bacterium]
MKRFIDQELKRWKEGRRRKPLILRGARQVGKTYSVRQFGKDCFDNVALVNLQSFLSSWTWGIPARGRLRY